MGCRPADRPPGEERLAPVRFTIVTPVLNGMPWLPEAVSSVARQRDDADFEIEHIVFDGGSTDGSREWLVGHPELGCELRFQPDHGQTDALVVGFDAARGELLGWLNADDVLEPGTLKTVHDLFAESPDVVMVSGACLFIDLNGRVIGAMATPLTPSFEGLVQTRINPPRSLDQAGSSRTLRRSAGSRAGSVSGPSTSQVGAHGPGVCPGGLESTPPQRHGLAKPGGGGVVSNALLPAGTEPAAWHPPSGQADDPGHRSRLIKCRGRSANSRALTWSHLIAGDCSQSCKR